MTVARKGQLRALRANLRRQLVTELSAPEVKDNVIGQLVARIAAIDVLTTDDSKRVTPKWKVPALIAAVAIALVGIASLIRMPRVPIDLAIVASEFQIQLGSGVREINGEFFITPGTLRSAKLQWVDSVAGNAPDLAEFRALQVVTLDAGAVLTFVTTADRCYELRIQRGELRGTLLRRGSEDSAAVPWPERIVVGAPGFLRFCSDKDTNIFIDGIEALSVSKLLRAFPPPAVHAPSIMSGEMNVISTNERRPLRNSDRVSLRGIREGVLSTGLGESLQLSFSGLTSQPALFGFAGPDSGSGVDLRPTLVDFVRSSPQLTAILAAIVGLAGTLVGLLQWLGFYKDS